jgi:3-methyladenine DNA glycosylase AlkD
MSTLTSIMADLKKRGSEKTRSIYIRHGAPADHTLGVSIAHLKTIAKTIKGQQSLACQLYETGVFEAMYLAGIVADGAQLTKKQLQTWAESAAHMPMVSEYTIPWLAVENPHARDLSISWIASKKENIAASGWSTYSGLVSTMPDDALDLAEIEDLLNTIVKGIGKAQNRVRYTMNGFVIAVGAYVAPLNKQARQAAHQIGKVSVDVGETACTIPIAADYIAKIGASGREGKKRKTIRC